MSESASPAPESIITSPEQQEDEPLAPRAPRREHGAVAAPTGKDAPSEPPTVIDPVVQAAMEEVQPAPGFLLTRLVTGAERQARGLPEGTVANLQSAMVEVLRLNSQDDLFARDVPPGTTVVVSLEGLAPLLDTLVFLVPLERVQGHVPPLVAPLEEPETSGIGFR